MQNVVVRIQNGNVSGVNFWTEEQILSVKLFLKNVIYGKELIIKIQNINSFEE